MLPVARTRPGGPADDDSCSTVIARRRASRCAVRHKARYWRRPSG
ncbi:hypothetical protein IOMTU133_0936 [Pseudomonas aeruginosa]|nr:hypothetical protein IOMTU133_0936 [Pseudomonas aeruginosa]